MIFLKNQNLTISILHPNHDQHRFGSRYCTGGYIWQITDNKGSNLLSGPQFPDPNPTKFDGQGVPEVFETALGHDSTDIGDHVLVIGVGLVLRSSSKSPFHVRDNPTVVDFCNWELHEKSSSVIMNTKQQYNEYSLELTREISLNQRVVSSRSTLVSTGVKDIPLRWFAHPFFPHTGDLVCCKFSKKVAVPQNQAFFLDENGFLSMQKEYTWSKGFYLPLEISGGDPVSVIQKHPLLNEIKINLNFPVSWLPVWANANTFSFEPYLDTLITPGTALQWSIEYTF